jgi:probable HAF family extracellular repeat protein
MRAQTTVVGADVIVLPTLGGTSTSAADINDAGQVVGSSTTADGVTRAFLWTPTDGMRDLGTLGGTHSDARAINEAGWVVGMSASTVGKSETHAFLWTPNNGMRDLGTLRAPLSYADGVNDAGQVVGNNVLLGLLNRPFVWTPADGMQELPALRGGFASAAAINDAGQVVGFGTTGSEMHALLWTTSREIQDLGALGGGLTTASGINDLGQVVGHAWLEERPSRAFLWLPGEGMRDLGTLGGASSQAYAINDGGQVVGYSTTAADNARHAFVWDALEGMVDLLAATGMSEAVAINNRGQVVGGNRVATLRFQFSPGAFITGSGFIAVGSRPTSKAHFAFSVKRGDALAPNGKVRCWVSDRSLEFESTVIENLIGDGNRAQFWGTGILNGTPARFRVTAVDGEAPGDHAGRDAFRIELWQAGSLVFDSQPGAGQASAATSTIDGGSIQFHRE